MFLTSAFADLRCISEMISTAFGQSDRTVNDLNVRSHSISILALKGEAQTTGWRTHDSYMSLCVSCVVKRYRVIHLVDCRCFWGFGLSLP